LGDFWQIFGLFRASLPVILEEEEGHKCVDRAGRSRRSCNPDRLVRMPEKRPEKLSSRSGGPVPAAHPWWHRDHRWMVMDLPAVVHS
jgi:hypothetical protein